MRFLCVPGWRLLHLQGSSVQGSSWTFLLSESSPPRSLVPNPSNLMLGGWRRSFSSRPTNLLLEHPKYSKMREDLAGRKDSLGLLESAGLFILDIQDLRVNKTILNLNQCDHRIGKSVGKNYENIKKLKAEGVLKTKKYTIRHDELILSSFKELSRQIVKDQETLLTELFSKCHKVTEVVLLQRNLVGFYLLQELDDWSQRLPVEVVQRLGILLSPGAFSRQEDEAILAWVEEHGPNGWAELAAKLGRNYQAAGTVISGQHQRLKDRQENKKAGQFTIEQVRIVIKGVFGQNLTALDRGVRDRKYSLDRYLHQYWEVDIEGRY